MKSFWKQSSCKNASLEDISVYYCEDSLNLVKDSWEYRHRIFVSFNMESETCFKIVLIYLTEISSTSNSI